MSQKVSPEDENIKKIILYDIVYYYLIILIVMFVTLTVIRDTYKNTKCIVTYRQTLHRMYVQALILRQFGK